MPRLFRSEDGYVLVFAILVLPVFIGFALLVIDVGRGNNAHGDLQASADAIALAGARELDGGVTAIPRARAAMANVVNSVSMLGIGSDTEIRLTYENTSTNAFYVAFLTDIPADDATEIDTAWLSANATGDSTEAEFIYVRAQSRNLETFWVNPVTYVRQEVPIAVYAVAKSVSAACRIPPIYMCNPFEYDNATPPNYVGDQLQTRYAAGELHGRLIRLHPSGPGTHSPGNFGFLQVNGSSSAAAINDLFAGVTNPTCYSAEGVTTKPGAANSISQGINTRFDIYAGSYGGGGPPGGFRPKPAENVRKGAVPAVSSGASPSITNECVGTGGGPNAVVLADDHIFDVDNGIFNLDTGDDVKNAYGLPDNVSMLAVNEGVPGAAIGTNDVWDIDEYFERNYWAPAAMPTNAPTTSVPHPDNVLSSFSGRQPSRYDVYRAEIEQGWASIHAHGDPSIAANVGEAGTPNCGASMSPARTPDPTFGVPSPADDRRVIVGAIIDCGSQSVEGGGINNYVVNSYTAMFMARPMHSYNPSADMTIDVEIIDITGSGGGGTLETFIRNEAILVR